MNNGKILDDDIGKIVFDQFLMIWILPEIEKRKESGNLPESFELNAAQVIFYPDDKKRVVRINNEIKVIAKVKFKECMNAKTGDPIYESQIESFEDFKLTEEDSGDCGHITMRRLKNTWTLVFDARYNKELAQKHVDKATEFYETAKDALEKSFFVPFIDNLFSATELAAKAILLIGPYRNIRETTLPHAYIKSLINRNAKMKNVKHEHADLYNELYEKRPKARYLKGDVKINMTEARRKLKITKDMIEYAKSRIQVE